MSQLLWDIAKKNIYDYLSQEHLSRTSVVNIKENTVFIPATAQKNIDLYYILKGTLDVLSQSYSGHRFIIDPLGPNEFVGKFSQMRQQHFYSEVKTNTPCTLLKLTAIRNELMNDERFLLFFCIKTSNRLYEMYKISMVRTLFPYHEILAYNLINLANKSGFISDTGTNICLKTNISERHYYYLIKKLRDKQIISLTKKGISIRDMAALTAIADNVTKFMTNQV